jgi:hypothetical protein
VYLFSYFAAEPTSVGLLINLGIGFLTGYGVREIISRARRRRYRTSSFFRERL